MGPKIEVIDNKSTRVASSLKALLADEYVLSMRTREAYRNVHGDNFSELRKLFESQHKFLDAIVDDVSRRVGVPGQLAPATLHGTLEATRLTNHNERFTKQNQIVEALLDDHESMIHALSKESHGSADEKVDIDTANFIVGLLGRHVEMAGALRNWL